MVVPRIVAFHSAPSAYIRSGASPYIRWLIDLRACLSEKRTMSKMSTTLQDEENGTTELLIKKDLRRRGERALTWI